jgi:hypothetical protein
VTDNHQADPHKLAALATKLRETAQHNGPPIRKTLNLIADEIDKLA